MPEKYAAVGHIVQVIGPVLDVQFEAGHLPSIYNAVRISSEGFNVPEPIDVTAEVEQHLGEGRVRCVAMEPTEGLVRGHEGVRHRRGHHRSRWACDAWPRDERARQARRSAWTLTSKTNYPIHRPAPLLLGPIHHSRNVRNRHQGHRPHSAVLEGRQNRIVRRRRRRQNSS